LPIADRITKFFADRNDRDPVVKRNLSMTFQQYVDTFTYLGTRYPVQINQTLPGTGGEEKIASNFAGMVQGMAKGNGIVFACMLARQMLFQEARFQYRELVDGRPGDYLWNDRLEILEEPWPGGTTGDLLARSLQMVDLTGTSITARRGNRLAWLRSDWVTIVAGSPRENAGLWDIDAEVIGYFYTEGGPGSGNERVFLPAETVACWTPIPDPVARFRGMPWTQTILTETEADQAATIHKRQFFANAATPNMAVLYDKDIVDTLDKFNAYTDAIEEGHAGVLNAYKTMYLTGAASVQVIGADFSQMDFKATQGAGETRICAAAGVPATIAGISEGLQGSSLNAGNYAAAFRRFADLFARPHWRSFAANLQRLVPPPRSNSPLRQSQLWYDDRDIPALRQDLKEQAEIQQLQAGAISTLVTAGFTPESAETAITTGEMSRLEHSNLYSVQLRPPGQMEEAVDTAKTAVAALQAANENGKAETDRGEE
jgi:hypothetical protein